MTVGVQNACFRQAVESTGWSRSGYRFSRVIRRCQEPTLMNAINSDQAFGIKENEICSSLLNLSTTQDFARAQLRLVLASHLELCLW